MKQNGKQYTAEFKREAADSIGLQIVGVYLWIANKLVSGQELPNEPGYL